MSGSGPRQPGRLTPRQALGWFIALAAVLALVILFFVFGRHVRPVLGARPGEAWPISSS
jgi:hypothetical protein